MKFPCGKLLRQSFCFAKPATIPEERRLSLSRKQMIMKMKQEDKSKVYPLVMTAVFAALLAVFSQISIPTPTGVPITLQTFAVALCAYVLGWRLGVLAVGVYLALGAVGLPVFAGFSGGFGVFLNVTGGFLWGFLFLALLCGLGTQMEKPVVAIPLGVAGLLLCHLCGVLQFGLLSGNPLWESILLVSVPYLLKDTISVVLAYPAAKALRISLKKAKLVNP